MAKLRQRQIQAKLETIFEAKKQRRNELANLPIEDKIQILVELQKIALGVERKHNKDQMVWELPEPDKPEIPNPKFPKSNPNPDLHY